MQASSVISKVTVTRGTERRVKRTLFIGSPPGLGVTAAPQAWLHPARE